LNFLKAVFSDMGGVNPNGAYFLSHGFPVYCRERYIMENESTRINTN